MHSYCRITTYSYCRITIYSCRITIYSYYRITIYSYCRISIIYAHCRISIYSYCRLSIRYLHIPKRPTPRLDYTLLAVSSCRCDVFTKSTASSTATSKNTPPLNSSLRLDIQPCVCRLFLRFFICIHQDTNNNYNSLYIKKTSSLYQYYINDQSTSRESINLTSVM